MADLPNGTVTGSCSNVTDVLNVAFRTNWMFSMTFNKDGGNAALDAVTLSYSTGAFPNVRDPGKFVIQYVPITVYSIVLASWASRGPLDCMQKKFCITSNRLRFEIYILN